MNDSDKDIAARLVVLERNLLDLANATRDNLARASSPLPGLILIYSAIDIVSWLDSGNPKVRKRFTSWVDKYLLPNPALRCKALELYAARCGLLHEYAPDSNLSRDGTVRCIEYVRGHNISAKEVEKKLTNTGPDVIVIDLREFFDAFKGAIAKFLENVGRDPARIAEVLGRSDKFFVKVKYLN